MIESPRAILLPDLNPESLRLAMATQNAAPSPSLRWKVGLPAAPLAVMLVTSFVSFFDAAYRTWHDLAGFALVAIMAALYARQSKRS